MIVSAYQTLIDVLLEHVHSRPHQLAYRFWSDSNKIEELTYEELNQRAQTIAAYLQQLNIPLGSRILLLYKPGLAFIAAFLGCLYAGMVAVPTYVPLDERQLPTLISISSDAESSLFLTTKDLLSELSKLLVFNSKLIGLATDDLPELHYQWQKPNLSSEQLAFLQYTSGSTDTPKGVMVSHSNILNNSAIIYQAFGHSSQSEGVNWLPHFHDMGLIGGILQPLYGGFSLTLMSPERFTIRPLRWLEAITCYQATTSGGPNFAYEWCVQRIKPEQLERLNLSSWEVAFTGAEPVRSETLERFAQKFAPCGFRRSAFYPCYGMAEVTLFITGGRKNQAPVIKTVDPQALEQKQIVSPSEGQQHKIIVSCGFPWIQHKVLIVDPNTLIQCQEGQVGEIWVTGKSITQGYWRKELETEYSFQAYLTTGEGPFLRTGDLGFWSDGELFITGRIKGLIIIRGRNFYPQDLELTAWTSHPALKMESSVAFSIDGETEEKLVILAEVQKSFIKNLDIEAVKQSIRQAIVQKHELFVTKIVLLKSGILPKTTSGKIRRNACKKSFLTNKFCEGELK